MYAMLWKYGLPRSHTCGHVVPLVVVVVEGGHCCLVWWKGRLGPPAVLQGALALSALLPDSSQQEDSAGVWEMCCPFVDAQCLELPARSDSSLK